MDYSHVVAMVSVMGISALGLNILMGYLGRIALAEIALIGVGAYCYAVLAVTLSLPTGPAAVLALAFSGCVGASMGLLVSRVRGDYYLLLSMSGFLIAQTVFSNWTAVTGGPFGILGVPALSGASGDHFAWILAALFVASAATCSLLERSRLVVLWRAIRDDETGAASLGVNVPLLKMAASGIAGLLLSLAGVLLASYLGVVEPTAFGISLPLSLLLLVCLGGLGRWKGAVAGAVCYILLDEAVRRLSIPAEQAAQWQQVLFSVTLLLLIFVRPQGLFGRHALTEAE